MAFDGLQHSLREAVEQLGAAAQRQGSCEAAVFNMSALQLLKRALRSSMLTSPMRTNLKRAETALQSSAAAHAMDALATTYKEIAQGRSSSRGAWPTSISMALVSLACSAVPSHAEQQGCG